MSRKQIGHHTRASPKPVPGGIHVDEIGCTQATMIDLVAHFGANDTPKDTAASNRAGQRDGDDGGNNVKNEIRVKSGYANPHPSSQT